MLIELLHPSMRSFFFFFNDTATTEIYTLSLHDALPISLGGAAFAGLPRCGAVLRRPPVLGNSRLPRRGAALRVLRLEDRKSTRLNSSHGYISYAVFCLKKKKTRTKHALHSTLPTV